jgi:hypothetical protein
MKDIALINLSDRKIESGLKKYNEGYKYLLQQHINAGWSFWSFVGYLKRKYPETRISTNDLRVWCHYYPEINTIRHQYLKRIGRA